MKTKRSFPTFERATVVTLLLLGGVIAVGAETLPPLKDGKAPETFEELWSGFDPRKEPLDVEVLHEWEQDGVVLKVIRYRVGIFKGKKAMMAAVYGYPKGAKKFPDWCRSTVAAGRVPKDRFWPTRKKATPRSRLPGTGESRLRSIRSTTRPSSCSGTARQTIPSIGRRRTGVTWPPSSIRAVTRTRRIPMHRLDPVESPRNTSGSSGRWERGGRSPFSSSSPRWMAKRSAFTGTPWEPS